MKKILLPIVVAMTMFSGCSAQKHLDFFGVPINGPLDEFVEKMEASGCEYVFSDFIEEIAANVAFLYGELYGNNGEIQVNASPLTSTVFEIIFTYDSYGDSWTEIRREYNLNVARLKMLYGEPIEAIETFEAPYKEKDGKELEAWKDGKYILMTKFKCSEGVVGVGLSYGSLWIDYIDRQNEQFNMKERESYKQI